MHPQTTRIKRIFNTADLPSPHIQLLSNGSYSVMLTTAGAGYSKFESLAVTRWREDVTRDHWGSFFYVRDVDGGEVWSAGAQPVRSKPQSYEVTFSESKVEIQRLDAGILTHTEIIVSPEENVELRRVSLTNHSSEVRSLEVTSYAEVVIAPATDDVMHPAFSNLFVETEFLATTNSLIAKRRPRADSDKSHWAVHTIVTEGEAVGAVQYETDRERFLGRGHDASTTVAVMEDGPLSNTVGAVLDPVFSLRQGVRLQPQETARISFITAMAETHEDALRLVEKYHAANSFEREEQLARERSYVEMCRLHVDEEQAELFQNLAAHVLYNNSLLRPPRHILALNTRTQSHLWTYTISGDLPIVLVYLNEAEQVETVRQLLLGHEFLRLKGLVFDLVILNDCPPNEAQEIQGKLRMLIRTGGTHMLQDKPGGVFLGRTDQIPEADQILFQTVARVVIATERGSLAEQLASLQLEDKLPAALIPQLASCAYTESIVPLPALSFFNGLGGFSDDGREYVTILRQGCWTPAPWSNILANEAGFGFQITETGGGYTWSVNSRENRLTPWSNDAVTGTQGEAVYLRDEETGEIWTPTPLPIREADPYIIRHGQGYTVFEHLSHGISQELLMFVPLDASVKISLLRLRNQTARRRHLSVTSYSELVLGVDRARSAPHIITEVDEKSGSVLARNAYNNEFAARVAFVEMSEQDRTVTCDRKEFWGRNGSASCPAAFGRNDLSNRAGAGLDPCAAMQAKIWLEPGETREIVILLGEGADREEALSLAAHYSKLPTVKEAFEQVLNYWDELLGVLQIHTPDEAMNLMVNRWLLYQTLACRMWARSAFYQSGGAYGFRDQLQDVMALVYSRPEIARAHIMRAASRQFKEGDVQHWWHPPSGRGLRTRFSDDLLWLPFVTSFYVKVTGDLSLLEEMVPLIEAMPLAAGDTESYSQPIIADETATVYEHCVRALDRSLKVGAHGLPLMGSGDWNDGMNRVGHEGLGESVWVGWFLFNTLADFTPFCDERGQIERARRYRQHMENLKTSLEENGWDGEWYRRAYFDDGTPLGSAQNEECRIDSIVQSWGVISGAADTQRAARAMAAVEEYLIRRDDGLIMLFAPPFDRSALNPGYIKGYVPGVRENGGQYTHAAVWVAIAYALLGDGNRAGEMLALLNPITHSSTPAGLRKYKVEPYVTTGDVYALWPHTGRGGWTWYTGSAGWMYRAAVESILGFQLEGDRLRLEPCIPRGWPGYELNYRKGATQYQIKVENPLGLSLGVAEVEMNGQLLEACEIPLLNDGALHRIRIVLGKDRQVRTQPP